MNPPVFASLDENYDRLYKSLSRDKGPFKEAKLDNLRHVNHFHNLLRPILEKHPVDILLADHHKEKYLPDVLFYRGGSPIYPIFVISPGGKYINYNPCFHLWKKQKIDDDILSKLLKYDVNRYKQPDTVCEVPEEYDLFPLGLSNHIYGFNDHPSQIEITNDDPRYCNNKERCLIGQGSIKSNWRRKVQSRDEWATLDAMKYATENKRLTLFKNPHAQGTRVRDWDDLERDGFVSKYTVYVEGNIDKLIEGARIVYSSDSMSTFQAMLNGKPTATYYNLMISEVTPVISTAKDMENIRPVPYKDMLRFLSWFYHKLSIDIYSDDASDKLERLIRNFKKGNRTKELFG
tara:strand:- start:131 stop:1171 length:1041 start_codon:yes stop_codon:yes gene_type:complete